MAKKIHRLSDAKTKTLSKPGWYADGHGLYLQVSQSGTKSWVYRYQIDGKERRHGLGAYPTITLKDARESAENCRKLRIKGFDPIDHKRQSEIDRKLEKANTLSFKQCALLYIDGYKNSWKNRKHEQQWRNTLETYAYPVIGDVPIQQIDVSMVLKVIEPIWYEKTETASRVRQRIEKVLDWAKSRGYRTGENPARWREHIENILPKRTDIQRVSHFNAMPYLEVPAYFIELRKNPNISALALALTILTATRNNEVREATWDEIDMDAGIWTIPEERMKAKKAHRVPLSGECLNILKRANEFKINDYVFPGLRKNRPLSNEALLKLLKSTHPTLTVHGFRSSFRDWCAEMTAYPREVAEAALAHSLGNATEAAYQRGDIFAKRSKLMNAWAEYCLKNGEQAAVVPIRSSKN